MVIFCPGILGIIFSIPYVFDDRAAEDPILVTLLYFLFLSVTFFFIATLLSIYIFVFRVLFGIILAVFLFYFVGRVEDTLFNPILQSFVLSAIATLCMGQFLNIKLNKIDSFLTWLEAGGAKVPFRN